MYLGRDNKMVDDHSLAIRVQDPARAIKSVSPDVKTSSEWCNGCSCWHIVSK